ncbi:hypothetical protein BC941DRAFT_391151 [Chlamydoabsidia padenii]|nr:hypothetical protein BC941DRAFT_391151 [Chlamydoabsidia padenii]
MDPRTPKKIGFGAVGGGSSHYMWVMEILQELHTRGYTSTLYTRDDSIRFAKEYPNIQTQSIGGEHSLFTLKLRKSSKVHSYTDHSIDNPIFSVKTRLPLLLANYSSEYNEYKSIIESNKMDLMICDMFAFACMDATSASKIPLIVTSTVAYSQDTTTGYVNNMVQSFFIPTTETMTLWERLVYFFYRVYGPLKARQLDHPTHAFQKQQGIPLIDSLHKAPEDAYKLINNMFGLEAPRPLGPLAQLVGPILRQQYDSLTPDLTTFLDSHPRVAYVAFGQHAIPSEQDMDLIMQALKTNLEAGHLDAVIWASPTHPTNTGLQHILVTKWAPQFAILQHPSTVLFVTHGGAGSVHEALYNKVPLFVFPFFGDQPVTARMVRQQELGDYIDTIGMQYTKVTLDDITFRIRRVLTDPTIQQRVSMFGQSMQIRALHAVQRAADVVEEMTVGAMGGKVLHLSDVGRQLSWAKRHNVDLVAVVVGFFIGMTWLGLTMARWVMLSKKIKTL